MIVKYVQLQFNESMNCIILFYQFVQLFKGGPNSIIEYGPQGPFSRGVGILSDTGLKLMEYDQNKMYHYTECHSDERSSTSFQINCIN